MLYNQPEWDVEVNHGTTFGIARNARNGEPVAAVISYQDFRANYMDQVTEPHLYRITSA